MNKIMYMYRNREPEAIYIAMTFSKEETIAIARTHAKFIVDDLKRTEVYRDDVLVWTADYPIKKEDEEDDDYCV